MATWAWIVTVGVWALFTVSLAWLLRHRGEPTGSKVGAAGTRVRRSPVGDNEPPGRLKTPPVQARRWRQRSWWSKTR
jgi:hypothetical protein